jgi:hypothetical protein
MNYLLDFLFLLFKQFTLIPIAPKTKKGRSESKLDFEAKFHVVTCYAFFTPLWPHPSLLSNQHHHGLVLIKLFTKNLHDNFEKNLSQNDADLVPYNVTLDESLKINVCFAISFMSLALVEQKTLSFAFLPFQSSLCSEF